MKVNFPILYVGTDRGHKMACREMQLPPTDLVLVRTTEKLHGYKDRVLFYDWGFNWIIRDPEIMGYCRSHNISVHSYTGEYRVMMMNMLGELSQ